MLAVLIFLVNRDFLIKNKNVLTHVIIALLLGSRSVHRLKVCLNSGWSSAKLPIEESKLPCGGPLQTRNH